MRKPFGKYALDPKVLGIRSTSQDPTILELRKDWSFEIRGKDLSGRTVTISEGIFSADRKRISLESSGNTELYFYKRRGRKLTLRTPPNIIQLRRM